MNHPGPASVSAGVRLLLLAPVLLLAACSSSGSTAGPRPTTPVAPTAAPTAASPVASGPELRVSGYHFPALSVMPGARIALIDLDGEPHTVSATGGAFTSRSFDSSRPGLLVAPTKPGSYAFICTIHPTMHGTLVVR